MALGASTFSDFGGGGQRSLYRERALGNLQPALYENCEAQHVGRLGHGTLAVSGPLQYLGDFAPFCDRLLFQHELGRVVQCSQCGEHLGRRFALAPLKHLSYLCKWLSPIGHGRGHYGQIAGRSPPKRAPQCL
jgi:hypothetical protein